MTKFKLERRGHVATITLDNPPLNTLDVPMLEALTATARSLQAEPLEGRPRVLLLVSGVSGQFSAGIDPKAVLTTDVAGRKRIFLALADLVEALWLGGIPVVADVSGPALAGGAVLATLADFAVIATQAGKISFSETKVGLPLPLFVQELVRSKINPASWNEVMLLGKNVDAKEAVRIGFANAAYDSGDEREELLDSLVGRITRLPPAVTAQTLKAGRASGRALLEDFRADLAAFADFLTDEYLGRGLAAIVRGETPKF